MCAQTIPYTRFLLRKKCAFSPLPSLVCLLFLALLPGSMAKASSATLEELGELSEGDKTTLSRLSALMQEAELLEEEKRVAKLRLELHDLAQKNAAYTHAGPKPSVTASPKNPAYGEERVVKTQQTMNTKASPHLPGSKKRAMLPKVYAMEEGVGGCFALLQSAEGRLFRVGAGTRFGNYVVRSISRQGVILEDAGQTHRLSFAR